MDLESNNTAGWPPIPLFHLSVFIVHWPLWPLRLTTVTLLFMIDNIELKPKGASCFLTHSLFPVCVHADAHAVSLPVVFSEGNREQARRRTPRRSSSTWPTSPPRTKDAKTTTFLWEPRCLHFSSILGQAWASSPLLSDCCHLKG